MKDRSCTDVFCLLGFCAFLVVWGIVGFYAAINGKIILLKATYVRLFFWTFAQKLKVKKTKTQAQKTQNSRIFCPKLKIPAIFSEIQEEFVLNIKFLNNLPKILVLGKKFLSFEFFEIEF